MDDDRSFPQRACGQQAQPNPTTELTQRAAGPNFFRDAENVQFMRAESVHEHKFADGVLRLDIVTSHQTHRTAQTHDSVMHQFVKEEESMGTMSFEISFFTPDIFRVKFAGRESTLTALTDDPEFPPLHARMLVGQPQPLAVDFREEDKRLKLKTSAVELHVQLKPFRLLAYRPNDKTPFWRQRLSDLFTSDIIPTSIVSHQGRHACYEAFSLDPDEAIYGLGERFDAVERCGRPIDFVNHDAIGTSNTRSYINVPFFWSTAGYGCFVNHVARTEWDVGLSEAGTVGFSTEEEYLDYFVIEGRSPKDILRKYTNCLTGTSPLPPVWSFGLWLSRNSYQSWDVVDKVLETATKHGIPFDTIHLDTSWFKEDWNPDLLWSKERFPEPEKKMAALKEKGVRVSLWQYNFVPPREDNILYVEARDRDFLGKEKLKDGSRGPNLFQYPEGTTGWKTDDLVVDHSIPEAAAWYGSKIARLIEQGASAIKTDFGDCIPPDAHYKHIEGRRFQNLYSLVYNAVVSRAMRGVSTDTAQWARSGTAGSQRYPVHWGGDSQCSWSGLQGSLRATLSIGLSGFAYFSHDIGGFIGTPTPELYLRWAQLVLMSSHARSHGAGDENGREPWYFGDEAVGIFRTFANLRYQLLPYTITQAKQGGPFGLPLVRAMVLEHPEDRNVRHIETQYYFGSDILVAPILQPAEEAVTRAVYLPLGDWFDLWTKEKTSSRGEWIELSGESISLARMPMFVRSGAMIPWAEKRLRTFNSPGKVEKVQLFGERPGMWVCRDGADGLIEADMAADGEWFVKGKDGVNVERFQ